MNLAVAEPYVYVSGTVGFFPGVHIISVANPAAPQEVGHWDYAYTGDMLGVAALGNTLYLGFNANGADPPPTIHILDVSDKANPHRDETSQPYGSLYNFLLKDTTLYVAGGPDGDLSAFDLADALHPAQKWRLNQPGSVSKVQVAGSRVYLMAKSDYRGVENGMWIYDISNPLSPVLIDYEDPFGSIHDFDISGAYLYLSGTGVCLQVTGASQLFPPLGSYTHEDGRCDSVEVLGSAAYVTVPGAGSLDTINVATPASPSFASRTVIASSPVSLGPARADGSRLFVKSASNQLTALNISDPLAPVKVTTYNMPTALETLNGMDIAGNYLYAATSNGMSVLDVSNLLDIRRVGTYAGYAEKSVDVQGSVAYLGGSFHMDGVNVQSPSAPVSKWNYSGPAQGEAIQAFSRYLLAADGELGLSLYAIADGADRQLYLPSIMRP